MDLHGLIRINRGFAAEINMNPKNLCNLRNLW